MMEYISYKEATKALLEGNKVRHAYYSAEEYVFLNEENKVQTEDGYAHGGIHGEFWSVIQANLKDNQWCII